jgi:KUP system potassium uptake protein
VPFVNWALYVCIVLAVVMFFGSSSALASAYGIAVTIDMLITTVMTFFVIRYGWKPAAGAVPGRHRASSSWST